MSGMTSAFTQPRNVLFVAAIVIDRNYVGEEYEHIKSKIEDYLVYAKREIVKHGGVNAHLFSWSAINLKRGADLDNKCTIKCSIKCLCFQI